MKIIVDKLPNSALECTFCNIKEGMLICMLDDETCSKELSCPYIIDFEDMKAHRKAAAGMTPEKFKEKAQQLYDDCKGYAGEEGHLKIDDLMCLCLESLGYEEGLKILFSMNDIWYA